MIGERIASGCAKIHKVFSTDADEGSEQRGSFRKVTRGRRANISRPSPVRHPKQGTEINSTEKENFHGFGCPEQHLCNLCAEQPEQYAGFLSKTLQQLSSGSRINSGADDAAGLSLANGLQASSTALSQSAKNASEGVDMLQVADGAMAQVTNLLNRAVTLATEASNGTMNSGQITAANAEYTNILTELTNINNNTEYNGITLFTGTAASIYTTDGTLGQSDNPTALNAVDGERWG